MVQLAEKLGFREEMRLRQARVVQGEYFDGMGYGILRQEWETLYPNGFAG
jgi:putative hydrolase of HD superfamily